MNHSLLIGIDPGEHNGYAVWDTQTRSYLHLKTLNFWELIEEISSVRGMAESLGKSLLIRLEYPNYNRPTFHRNRFNTGTLDRKAQNVGSNKADAKRIKEYLDSRAIPYELVKPSKATGSKLKADHFERLTGYKGRCSQHARDAAMLIWNR